MAQNGGVPGGMDMIQPHHIQSIPILNDEDKERFRNGLTDLWQKVKTNPKESETHQKAVAKIKQVSKDLMQRIARAKNMSRQQTQGGNSQPGSQDPGQSNTQQGQNGAQQVAPPQMKQENQVGNQMNQAPQQQRQTPQQGQQPVQPQRLSAQAEDFLKKFEVAPLPGMMPNSPEYAQHRARVLKSLQNCLQASDRYGPMLKEIGAREQQLSQMGQSLSQEQSMQKDRFKQAIAQAKGEFDRIKVENEQNRRNWTAQRTAANAQGPTGQAQAQGQIPQQISQPASTQGEQVQQQNQFTSQAQQPNPAQAQAAIQQQQQAQQRPQQQRPQPVPQQMQNAGQGQHAQALSHSDAIKAINRTYSDQIPQVQPAIAAASRPSGTPTSASTTAAQPFSTTQQSTPSINNSRMQIPHNLTPTPIQPIQMNPSRPTIGPGPQGMMGQPGFQKPPGFTLEGEEGRVLSKKKLDELVRQVTGGGEGLTPEVEEAVLTLADDFVDSVLTAACRLAKIRPNATLDIRDIQLVLERNYNIRVPGYALDEVRTVRKFQPAAGWQQKMNAVQAAKVMGKNDA